MEINSIEKSKPPNIIQQQSSSDEITIQKNKTKFRLYNKCNMELTILPPSFPNFLRLFL